MSKRAWWTFLAIAAVFAIVIPFWVMQSKGTEGAAAKPIAASDHTAQTLFQTNCGACHTLAAGGTDGVVGPNLDYLLASNATESQDTVDGNCSLVLTTILHGIGGRMPAGILVGQQAEDVASFVARNLNYVGEAPPTPGQPSKPITPGSTNCGTSSSSSSSSSGPSSSGAGGGTPTGGGTTGSGGGSGGSSTSKPQASGTSKAPGGTVAISADPTGQLKFEQTKVTSKPGAVKIDFTNKSPVPHDVKIQDSSGKLLGGTNLVTGGSATAAVNLTPGTYTFYCDVPGHEEAGMKGTLVVK
jgi:plastocyanin/mono/diheme cytochrome c family protein